MGRAILIRVRGPESADIEGFIAGMAAAVAAADKEERKTKEEVETGLEAFHRTWLSGRGRLAAEGASVKVPRANGGQKKPMPLHSPFPPGSLSATNAAPCRPTNTSVRSAKKVLRSSNP